MFRHATFDDIPRVTMLLEEFYARHEYRYGVRFNSSSAVVTVERMIRHGVCLVGPSSCAGAMIADFPYNFEAKVANVMFWYFRRPREIKIFEALLAACRRAGAMYISASSHAPSHAIGRLYQRWGMQPVEGLHMGPLINVAIKPEAS